MRKLGAWVAIVLSTACSGGTSTEVTPEPSAAPPPSTAAPPSSAPATTTVEAPPTSVAPPETTSVAVAIPDDAYVAQIPVTSEGTEVVVAHPDPAVNGPLNAMIASGVAAFNAQFDDDVRMSAMWGPSPTCVVLVATEVYVSIECQAGYQMDERGPESAFVDMYEYAIEGGNVSAVSLADSLRPGPALDARIAAAGREAFAAMSTDQAELRFPAEPPAASALSVDGVILAWPNEGGRAIEGWTPYDELADSILPSGPLAHMLRVGAYASTTTAAATDAGPWAVLAPMPLAQAATRWAALPSRLRPAVIVFSTITTAQLGVRAEAGIDVARQVATALGGSLAAPPTGAHVVHFEERHATSSVNVRDGRASTASWLATLPRDSVFATVVDPADPTPDWAHVVAAPGIVGWASTHFVTPERCTIDPAQALAALPADVRDEAASTMTAIRAVTSDGNTRGLGALFVSHANGHSYVALRNFAGPTCGVGAEIASWTVDGEVVDALVTHTTRRGGETLVVVQTARSDGTTTALALRRGAPLPVWQLTGLAHPSSANELRAPATLGPSGRGFWPVARVRRREPIVPYRWADTTLAVDAP